MLKAIVAGAVLCLMLGSPALSAPPQRVLIEYEVKYSGKLSAEASATTQLTHDGKRYALLEESRASGLAAVLLPGVLRRSAKGVISEGGLKPAEFRDQRGSRPENVAQFDWGKAVLRYLRNGKMQAQALPEPHILNDRLSFLWTFAFRPPADLGPGKEIRALLSDGRGLSAFSYVVSGRETLQTPAGRLQTVKLVKQREPGDDRVTEIWLAIERHRLPVRILVVEKDGSRVDQIAKRIDA